MTNNQPIPDHPQIAKQEFVAVSSKGLHKTFESYDRLELFLLGKCNSEWAVFMRLRWGGGSVDTLRNMVQAGTYGPAPDDN